MRKLMEKQLSCLALLMTAFYSLLASCRGEECGSEELARCARPLERISGNGLGFITKKEDLIVHCPIFEASMECIKEYNVRCLEKEQRGRFNDLYYGTNMVIKELCQEGPYQDEFLRHAPCMQKVQLEYERCYKTYQETMREMETNRSSTSGSPIKTICCTFQEYLECSHHKARRSCGEETARFTKEFLDRMASSLMTTHCEPYAHKQCATAGASSAGLRIEAILPLTLIIVTRYFT